VANGYIFYHVKSQAIGWQGKYNPDLESEINLLQDSVQPIKCVFAIIATMAANLRTRWYPLVYLLVSIMPLINRVHNVFYPTTPSFPLYLAHAISAPLQGLASYLVFVAYRFHSNRHPVQV
jgi:hypothetical protein